MASFCNIILNIVKLKQQVSLSSSLSMVPSKTHIAEGARSWGPLLNPMTLRRKETLANSFIRYLEGLQTPYHMGANGPDHSAKPSFVLTINNLQKGFDAYPIVVIYVTRRNKLFIHMLTHCPFG